MGIVFSFLEFFDVCYRQQALQSPMLALGSLEINEPAAEIQAFAAQNPSWQHDPERGVHSLFRDRYGVTDYRDCDLNDKADLTIDLNQPLGPELIGSAMTILNGGTIEHIFDIAQTLINIHDMAHPGATIIHLAPISWYEHGYYNFNPRLFTAVAKTNAYALLAEAFWFPVCLRSSVEAPPVPWQPVTGSFATRLLTKIRGQGKAHHPGPPPRLQEPEAARPSLYMTFDGQQYTSQQGEVSRLLAAARIPTSALYMVAYQKTASREFVFPYDLQV